MERLTFAEKSIDKIIRNAIVETFPVTFLGLPLRLQNHTYNSLHKAVSQRSDDLVVAL